MNAEQSLALARRFIELPLEKRRLFLASLRQEGVDFAVFPIPADVPVADRDALSYAQRRMWFLWKLAPDSAAYNLPGAVRLDGPLDAHALAQAFARLIERHQTLRTVFPGGEDEQPRQAPAATTPELAFESLEAVPEADREALLRERAEAEALLPFDLSQGPLLRLRLLRLGAERHALLLTLHHIVSDGWSMNVLIDELIQCYAACVQGREPALLPLPVQYADYALWQRRWLEAGEQARQLDYWRAQLGEQHPVLALPTDYPRPPLPSYRGRRHELVVGEALAERLRSQARAGEHTLFMWLLAGFKVLLHRYSGERDLRVGSPVANRHRPEVEGLIGLFVNTQVLRSEIDPGMTVRELLAGLRHTVLGAQGHQDLPFEQLVEGLKVERSVSHSPLFQVMYNHQPQVADLAAQPAVAGVRFAALEGHARTTQFDLSLDTYEQGSQLRAALTYATDLFAAATVQRMGEHWLALLQAMVEAPDTPIGELPMLAASERSQLVEGFNATAVGYPLEQPVHRLIEAQALRTPDAPALAFADQHLSYAELNRRANQLAWALQARGVGPDVIVGVALERSVALVVALLAILKAGGAYLPLDPEYPAERLAYMLEDSGVGLVLSHSAIALPAVERIDLDGFDTSIFSDQNPNVALTGEHLAYLIYTSGSTGKPKGAGNRHSALTNRLCWMQQAYQLTANDSVLQKTPFSFDVSVWEFFWPLMTGARLVVAAPGAHRDPAQLIEVIQAQRITTLHFVPSMLQVFLQDEQVSRCTSLTRIVCSGEALPVDAQQQVFAKLPKASLYNLYGPTEAAIDVTHWTCVDEGRDSVPIGQPIANLACYVLDAHLEPVPVGVLGELYLGGAGLARGYHRRPALTSERFVASPFTAGQRLYRTGDLARYRADGVIEYAGRVDHQIKLRGLRIELGEIEARLLEHPAVREAAVLAVDGKQLVGYVVLKEATEGWQADLVAHLSKHLPEYMVPAQWLALAAMPLSPNGKLERRALPRPAVQTEQAHYQAPHTEAEQALAGIWQALLGVEQVGLADNFFALGGDSIISIQLVSRARQAGWQLSPRDVFQYQSLGALAQAARPVAQRLIEQAPGQGAAPLAPVQRMFFEQAVPNPHHWNQALLLEARAPIDAGRLRTALGAVLAHHDGLRLRFEQAADGQWQQAYQAQAADPLWQREAANATALQAVCNEAQRSLNLAHGPLLRAVLVNMADSSQRLLLAIHHLVVDGVSWRILLEDLAQVYSQPEQRLPARTSSYGAWSERLAAAAAERVGELAWWQANLAGASAELPFDHAAGGQQNRHGHTITWTLPAERTRQLLQLAPAAYRTQVNDLLLTALARSLCRWSGQPSALVELEGHGREALFDSIDLSRTVGWFTSLFPLRLIPTADLPGSLKAIKEQLRAVPDKGVGYGLLRYLAGPASAEALAGLPRPQVTFNYLGQFDAQFDSNVWLRPASESPGQAQDDQAPLANALSVEGRVYGGELQLGFTFSRERFNAATVQGLVNDFAAELEGVIDHCCTPGIAGLTPSDVPLARLSQPALDALALPWAQVLDLYPLSPMQQGMLFHCLEAPGEQAYVSQLRADVSGLNVERFHHAWRQAVARHDLLRTGFLAGAALAQPLQVVYRQATLAFSEHAWQGADGLPQRLHTLAEREHAQGFDLACPPLARVVLVRVGADRHHLIYTSHHLLMDGWSNAQLLAEIIAEAGGEAVSAPIGRYRDHIQWLQGRDSTADETFWRGQLSTLNSPTRLAEALPATPGNQGYGQWQLTLSAGQAQALDRLAKAHAVTLSSVMQAAWLLLLQRYCGQGAVACGVTLAGRPADVPGIERHIGLFINTLPLIANPQPHIAVSHWLAQVHAQGLALREHEHTPLYDVQRWAGAAGSGLFDTLLVVENFPVSEGLRRGEQAGVRFEAVVSEERTNYPLTVAVMAGTSLALTFDYDRQAFADSGIERLGGHLLQLLEGFSANPAQALGNLALLAPGEQPSTVPAAEPYDTTTPCLVGRFEAQAAAHPAATALVQADHRLSYADLNGRANRLAHRLIAAGVGPETRIGVAMERSPVLVVTVLAILKAGAAYVPLDPHYPRERLQAMVEDSGPSLLLVQPGINLEHLGMPGVQVLQVGDDLTGGPAELALNPPARAHAHNLAYLMFTSGSSGRPKGVAIERGVLARHVAVATELLELHNEDRVLQFGTFSFDTFVEQLYPALCVGAAVILRGAELWDSAAFRAQVLEQRISVADLPTAYWHQLARDYQAAGTTDLGPLRRIHLGGEPMPAEGVRAWREAGLGRVRLVNLYGPTEATVSATAFDCAAYLQGREPVPRQIPIGRALGGRSLYVVDANLNPVPEGVAGELLIGGELLARGYFGLAPLTAQRFIADPFKGGGARLYRSGDLVRLRADGGLDYLGRADQQVKVRGFRVELAEIEARLLEQPGVAEAVVLADNDRLIAYVVGQAPTPGQGLAQWLRPALAAQLPAFMLPGHWVALAQLPLSPSGKLDRNALPLPDPSLAQALYQAPRTPREQAVAAIWAEVLGVAQVGLADHFFELGGHSLLATQLVSRLRQRLGLEVPLRAVFEQPVLEPFAAALADTDGSSAPPLVARPRGNTAPLSYAQERLWFLWQLAPESTAYHLPSVLRLRGALDRGALQRSFSALVARHESLRTCFESVDGQPRQRILQPSPVTLVAQPAPADEAALQARIAKCIARPFDLAQGPLLRIELLQTGVDEHLLVLVQHHIVSDAWSMQVMVREWLALYAAERDGTTAGLPTVALHYADYAHWQREWLASAEHARQLAYWQRQLGDEHPVLALPTDYPRRAPRSDQGARLSLAPEPTLLPALQALAREESSTAFMLLLASFHALLHRYSGQAGIRVGVPVAGRNQLQTEGLIGFFVNTQVLKADLPAGLSGRQLLRQVRERALQAQAHQDLPFEHLVEALKVERSLSHSPLFQVLFNHQAHSAGPAWQAQGLEVSVVEAPTQATQFDLGLETAEDGGQLRAALTYATDLFAAATVERMGEHWLALLQAMVEAPDTPIGELPMLAAGERSQLVEGFNATAVSYPLEQPVHRLIEAQALRTPDAPALAFADQHLSYAELNRRANQLAQALQARGIGPDVIVGVALERSVALVVALLAILKAGGAYLPLDPEYPAERLAYMLEDSGVGLVLSHSAIALPAVERIDLDGFDTSAYGDQNLDVEPTGEHLAYLIYTSGSTGKPKGAGNRHSALTNRLCWMQQAYQLTANDSVLQKTPFSFDVSVWEFFWPLMTGARLVVAAPGAHRDPAQLIEVIQAQQITTLHFVPSMLQVFLQDEQVSRCTSLTRIVCSGEALPVDAQQQVFAKLPKASLYNLYGPTEAAIDVTHWTCVDEGRDSVPIGQPIANLACYVLDAHLEPVPVGVLGELYLGGEGLARGYHRRPALTSERFVASPFKAGQRLYRTGDLARYRTDGVIEYAGRVDHQIKLRGLRIELGEIEARVLEHPAVREAAVLAVDGKQLVGYVVLKEATEGWQADLVAHLSKHLPEYMVPAQWLALAAMPLSPNGKLERRALPRPAMQTEQAHYQAPHTEAEQALAGIWQALLGVEQVGLADNFFALGGDSIISIQLVSRARQAGWQLSPRDVFQYQSLGALAQAAKAVAHSVIDQSPVTGETPLLPFQRQFFEQAIPNRQHWNQSVLLQPREPLNAEALEAAVAALLAHHDALRLRFSAGQGGWRAAHAAPSGQAVLWQRGAATADELLALCEAAQRSLNLNEGPLLRAMLVSLADGTQRLLLVAHHLVVDGVSWRILLEDLHSAYSAAVNGREAALPAKTSAFKTWAERLGAYALSDSLAAEQAFWQAHLAGEAVDLPCLDASLEPTQGEAVRVQTRLDRATTQALLGQAGQAYRTQVNDLLLTALARVICRWSNTASLRVQLEGHGREDLFEGVDLSRTVGWFTSLYPVRLTPALELGASIKAIKEQLRAIPHKGLGFGVLRYLAGPDVAAAMAQLPPARVTFNYLGQFDSQFDPQALLRPALEAAGAETDPQAPLANWLNLDGQVYGGELVVDWTFSERQFELAQVRTLAEAYASELRALVAHCANPGEQRLTPSDVPLAGLDQARLDALALSAGALEDLYPLSPMQQGMLFHSWMAPGNGDYINQLRLDVQGLDPLRFERAWQAALDAHGNLRASFHWPQGQGTPLQWVHRQVKLPFTVEPAQATYDENALNAIAQAQREAGFDLEQAPLLRLHLVPMGAARHHLIFTCHHLLLDGWSTSRLLGEVLQRYAGQPPAPVAGTYRDYIGWLQQRDQVASEAFWREQLARLDAPTRLARAFPAEQGSEAGQGELCLRLPKAASAGVQALARHCRVTANTVVQAAWALLLQRYTGQATVCFGATVAGRPGDLPGVQEQVGLFINTLPVIAQPRPEQALGAWLQRLQADNVALREHEHTPLYDIQRWAGQGGEALFDSLLVFENYPVAEALQQAPAGLSFGPVMAHEQTSYPLTAVVDLGAELVMRLGFSHAAFAPARIAELGEHWLQLLTAMSEAEQRPVGELCRLPGLARAALVDGFNATAVGYPLEQPVHRLIEAQALRTPDAPALAFADQHLSYAELNRRANQLAQALQARGVGPDVIVGVALERSVALVVALLAILKAGGAYLPLDPEYPAERLAYMLEDSGVALVLSHSAIALPAVERIDLDGFDTSAYRDQNLDVELTGEHLAYLIYTSGSTGKPKGAGNRHSALTNRLCWMQAAYQLTANDSVLQKTPFSFDVSVWEFFWPLMTGARLVVAAPGAHRDPAQLIKVIQAQRITTLHFVPSMLQVFLQDEQVSRCASLSRIVCSGEALPVDAQQQVFAKLPKASLYNLYGPTEAAIDVTHWTCVAEGRDSVPIGQPIANLACYVLDAHLEPVPVGVLGELYLGGAGLARGYHRRPALTSERFVASPFKAGQRLYRTGDLARYRADGVIEYAGRVDHQIKLRGLRIELGEIEARLLEHGNVREAAVLAVDGKQLVGYVVLASEQDGWQGELATHLAAQLPDYMVPAQWQALAAMPLSPNGKLERRALPRPEAASQVAYQAPVTKLEQALARIWAGALDVAQVGLGDDFFALGGHSLLATQVVMQVREHCAVEVPLKLLFTHSSLRGFCAEVALLTQAVQPLQDELAKSLEALKRLTADDLEKLLS